MPAPDRRSMMRDQLRQRTQESASKADDTGRFSNIFRPDVRIPLWNATEGQHVIDILPYIVGQNYPSRTFPDTTAGSPHYVLDIWVHRGIGVNEDSFVCPARNYDLPCPVCEHIAELRRLVDPDADENDPEFGDTITLIKTISPKRRTVYNILCWDSDREVNKGVQVWEVAHYFMEKNLTAIAERPQRGGASVGGFINFSDPWDGKSVVFRREGKGRTTSFLGHAFEDRPEPVPDEFNALNEGNENATYCLDELIVVPEYSTLYEAYYGKPYRGEQTVAERAEQAVPATSRSRPATRPQTGQQAAPAPAGAPAARGRAQSAARGQTQAPAAAPQPASRPRQQAAAPPPEPVDNDDLVCPAGGTFGQDVDQYEQCSNCEIWDDCAQAQANLAAPADEPEPEPEPEPTPAPARGRPAAGRQAPATRQAPASAPAPAARTRQAPPAAAGTRQAPAPATRQAPAPARPRRT